MYVCIYIYTRNSARFARRFLVPAEGLMLAALRSASRYPLPIYINIYIEREILLASLADFKHFAFAKWCFRLTPHDYNAPVFVFAIQL